MTGIFWSDGDIICGPEPWHATYRFGGEVLRRELLHDEKWLGEALEQYELTEEIATLIRRIADRRHSIQDVVALTIDESSVLLPPDSKFRSSAVKHLEDGGVFRVP